MTILSFWTNNMDFLDAYHDKLSPKWERSTYQKNSSFTQESFNTLLQTTKEEHFLYSIIFLQTVEQGIVLTAQHTETLYL